MSEAAFACPSCGKQYRWKAELAGRRVRCKCNAVMNVPASLDDDDDAYALSLDEPTAATQPTHSKSKPRAKSFNTACEQCGKPMADTAVVCVNCGYNRATGESVHTQVGLAVKAAAPRRQRSVSDTGYADGFFGRLQRSWEFAKIAYGLLWDFKRLLVFPLLSGTAALLVLLSFWLPLAGTGTMEQLTKFLDEERAGEGSPLVYALVFAFYFCNFFVIVFFNTALAACTMKVCEGDTPTLGYGLKIAVRRLPQIISWALVAATVGLILKIIENNYKKAGKIIAAVMGTAWTVLTYFVVPVLAAEGVGPVEALKRSVGTLKSTWGEAVLGNFALGWINFILTIPLLLLWGFAIYLGVTRGSDVLLAMGIVMLVLTIIVSAIAGSAADVVFRALLYNYATGRTIPEDIDEEMFAAAFASERDE